MIRLETITPHVVADTSGWSSGNFGGISLENFSVAVDSTSSPDRGKIFREHLEVHFGLSVKYLLLTHYHYDHTRGMTAFKDTTIISSVLTEKKIRSRKSATVRPSVTFKDNHLVKEGDFKVEIIHTGGHTAGSSYIYFPYEKVVFAGDLIFEGYMIFAGYGSNPEAWIDALENFKRLKLDKIVPGHGPILEPRKDLDKHLTLLYSLREVISEAAKQNKDPKKLKTPDFVFALSDRIPDSELTKWFHRMTTSWFKYYKKS
ncbi:MAG: MBL fold metallo-hydrolase [Candidatus Hodarchaeales archaeon]|jgi:cyclase